MFAHRTLPLLLAAMRQQQQQRLVIDTDVGIDDLVAIHALLATTESLSSAKKKKKKNDNVAMLTTVGGMSEPCVGASNLRTIFPQCLVLQGLSSNNNNDGDDDDRQRIPEWLIHHRRDLQTILSDHYFDNDDPSRNNNNSMKTCTTGHDDDSDDSNAPPFQDFYSFLRSSPDESVTLLCLGPLTNVAHWLQSEHGTLLDEKVSNVWILGGNDPSLLHSNKPEFNFVQDAAAARLVLSSSMAPKIRLVLASDVSPDKHPKVVEEIVNLVVQDDAGALLSKLLQAHPESACFDPICAFLMKHAPAMVTLEKRKIATCGETGLLQLGNADGVDLAFATQIPVETEYLPWIRNIVLADQNQ